MELRNKKLFLFDLDGTLYLGETLFPFTKELLATLRATGRDYLFMTNNSSKSVADYVKKLRRLGIPAEESDFVTSAQATLEYLQETCPGKALYVCGTASLQAELAAGGFQVTADYRQAQAVVMGFDTELTFRKLEDVCRILTQREVPYLATNPDLVCPTEFGFVPDCGSVCAMVYNATGRRPKVLGKPETAMVRLAMARKGAAPGETAVVGDRMYTDVQCGLNAGVASILVMSGETTPEILAAYPGKPTLVLPDCGAILRAIQE